MTDPGATFKGNEAEKKNPGRNEREEGTGGWGMGGGDQKVKKGMDGQGNG